MMAGDLIGAFGLTEPDHGSDPGGMKSRAVKDVKYQFFFNIENLFFSIKKYLKKISKKKLKGR